MSLKRALLLPVLRLLGARFFEKKYLKGRFFDDSLLGWRWVLTGIWQQKLLGFNRTVPWPICPTFRISDPENLEFDVHDIDNFQSNGCYFQNFSAPIRIGKGTNIAPNVGIITANHDPGDPARQLPGSGVTIGRKCWIGMNAVILPGIELGDHVVVGAGAVVTRSFPDGHCVIAGNPARLIRALSPPAAD